MAIAIIGGTGDEGFGLALRFALAGEDVVIGSRSQERGAAAAEKAMQTLGDRVEGTVAGTSNEEASASDVVFVTVPYAGQADIYRSIREAIRPDAVVCDTTTPLATAVGRLPWQVVRPWEGSAAEQAKALLPATARLVSGFHTISAEALQDLDHPLEGDVLVCGADPAAKALVGGLAARIPNLSWVDAGVLSMARILEPMTALMVSVNRTYRLHTTGVSLTGRDGWGPPPAREPRTDA
jgi:8-hydroxy-5-deazaflavin:NADPH oxidoreductase